MPSNVVRGTVPYKIFDRILWHTGTGGLDDAAGALLCGAARDRTHGFAAATAFCAEVRRTGSK